MSPTWHRLHLSGINVPPLLFQYTWTQKGYEIYLTDLTHIWSERLSQKQIINRAEDKNTTIDPGEDLEQINVLLEKINEALQKGKDSVVLISGTEVDSLDLRTTTKLPAPLKPLEWEMKLSKGPSSYLTSMIIFPLLKEGSNWELRQRDLLEHLKQKDIVLSKLFDKIEALGVDLGTVFPSAVGSRKSRKGTTRSEAARFVKGIEPFKEQAWLDEKNLSNDLSNGSELDANLIREISDSGEPYGSTIWNQSGEQWWRRLTGVPESDARKDSHISEDLSSNDKHPNKSAPQSHVEDEGDSTASSDNDEFQVCHTPDETKIQNPIH